MRFTSVLLLSMGAMAQGLTTEYVQANARSMWSVFKQDYNKVYSPSEEARRFSVFRRNLLAAAEMGAEYGASPFADLTAEEFAVYHSAGAAFGKRKGRPGRSYVSEKGAAAAAPVDWRQKGAVTNVKNQGQCGSCWSFSTTGNVEGQWFLAGNKLTSLSEEQLVACDKIDDGCNGGLPVNAYKYIEKAGGLETEEAYPYTSGTGRVEACKFDAAKVAVKISGGAELSDTSEAGMLSWLGEHGPISIGVYAGGLKWQLYTGGIMKGCDSRQPDHGVLIVGYGTEGGTQYWIIKNSWGSSWGENGYLRVVYGDNECNITSMPSSSKI